jgi:hypothetical protein
VLIPHNKNAKLVTKLQEKKMIKMIAFLKKAITKMKSPKLGNVLKIVLLAKIIIFASHVKTVIS